MKRKTLFTVARALSKVQAPSTPASERPAVRHVVCYAVPCENGRPEDVPFCAQHWAAVVAEHREQLLALYTPGQHATGQCRHGWIDALTNALHHLETQEI